jgi:para-nitrobenzyl esterase
MPDLPENIFAAGKQNDVPLLTTGTANDLGSNAAMGLVKTLEEYKQLAAQQYGASATDFLAAWPATNDAKAVKQAYLVMTNTGFGLAARDWARRQAQTGKQPSYLGLVARIQPYAPGSGRDQTTATSCHACDIVYWMGTLDVMNMMRPLRNWTDWDRMLSKNMQAVIIAFAKTGNPNTPQVKFPKYDPANEQRVVFGDTIFVETLNTPGVDFLQAHPIQGRGPAGGNFPGAPNPGGPGPSGPGRGGRGAN